MDKLKLGRPVLVEGKYDKIRLSRLILDPILCTDGFRVFRDGERLKLIRKLGETHGIVILTDSDGAGKLIRRYIASALPPERIFHLYTPQIPGKEKRKEAPSKEGFLGVEGIPDAVLYRLLSDFAAAHPVSDATVGRQSNEAPLTKADFYALKLTGCADASVRRDEVSRRLDLPAGMSAQALMTAVNVLMSRDSFLEMWAPAE